MTDPSVVLEEVETASGHVIGVATLNSEATLNALSLAMIHALRPKLDEWSSRDEIACVMFEGAGDRAFCAGGDVLDLYRAMVKNFDAGAIVDDTPERFFENEYRLDHQIHTYPKPTIAFGDGLVMGGGLGIFSASRYRIVTLRSRIAMPEVSIGLFPDAGATWLLRNMPRHRALYLGVTASQMNGGDALEIGLGTHAAAIGFDLIGALRAVRWEDGEDALAEMLATTQEEPATPQMPESNFGPLDAALGDLTAIPQDVPAAYRLLDPIAARNDWTARGVATMHAGCPTSVGIVLEQLRRAPELDLAGCFRLEMVIASQCARHEEFAEGIRARLVDKDNAPAWRFDANDGRLAAHVDGHFEPPWRSNPLADLAPACPGDTAGTASTSGARDTPGTRVTSGARDTPGTHDIPVQAPPKR